MPGAKHGLVNGKSVQGANVVVMSGRKASARATRTFPMGNGVCRGLRTGLKEPVMLRSALEEPVEQDLGGDRQNTGDLSDVVLRGMCSI